MPSTPGAQLGRYRPDRTTRRGGMGEVFLAHDPQLDRRVLILLPAHLAGDGLARDRLRREALADSYGGVVVSEAGNHPKVTALVHITAFAPDKCESVSSLIANPAPGAPVPPILFLDRENFAASFAADVRADFAHKFHGALKLCRGW